MANTQNLEVYHRAHRLTLDVYAITRQFPDNELFGLTTQMRQSAASIGMNLAEGSGRSTDRDHGRFVAISQGSTLELEYQLQLAHDLDLLDADQHADLAAKAAEISRMLRGMSRRLAQTVRQPQ